MKTVEVVTKGELATLPMKKGGWGYVRAEENGIVISIGEAGAFISEEALLDMGYTRTCTPSDSEEEEKS